MGSHQLPGSERSGVAGEQLVFVALRTQALSDYVHHHLHHIFFCMWISHEPGMILLARAVQGAGGGALQPLSQSILLETFPPEKRGIAMAVFALGVVVAPVLGPTLGGWLTDTYSWRWAFYINIPVGVFAIFMITRYVEDPPYIKHAKAGKLDTIGLGLLAIWLACLQIILDKGQEDD